MAKISSFRGKYFFLSNYYSVQVTYHGITYKNTEAAFHAQKDVSRSHEFQHLSPSEAKRLGRSVDLREGWDDVRLSIMTEINKAKFDQNKDLLNKLLDTKYDYLEEGNTWHDRFWGVCDGKGQNNLGLILMFLRKQYQHIAKMGYMELYLSEVKNNPDMTFADFWKKALVQ